MESGNLCEECKKYVHTYKVASNNNLLHLCDYCYHILKWKISEKEFIVETHISTKESIRLYHQAIKDFLIPQFKGLINKDSLSQLLKIEKERSMDLVLMELKKNHQNLIKQFCMKNNLNYPELITCLRLFQDS